MKGERERLGHTRRRLADGIRLPCPSPFAESVPHNAKVWGTHHPGSLSGSPGLDRVSEESAWGPSIRARAPPVASLRFLHSSFCISPLPPAEKQPEFVRNRARAGLRPARSHSVGMVRGE